MNNNKKFLSHNYIKLSIPRCMWLASLCVLSDRCRMYDQQLLTFCTDGNITWITKSSFSTELPDSKPPQSINVNLEKQENLPCIAGLLFASALSRAPSRPASLPHLQTLFANQSQRNGDAASCSSYFLTSCFFPTCLGKNRLSLY